MAPATRPTTPRIAPATPADLDDEAGGYLERLIPKGPDGGTLNVFATFAHHPPLLRAFVRLTGELILNGTIPARQRELLILRTAWNCRSVYEWGQHVVMGRNAGLSDDEIQRVRRDAAQGGWEEFDAVLLRVADELHEDACVSDATWAELSARYSTAQVVEAVMLVGQYTSLSFFLNSAGVELDAGIPGW